MTVGFHIEDPTDGSQVKVSKEGTVEVVVHPHPPFSEQVIPLPFRQFFTDNGSDTGDEDMRVDGSVTNVDFYVEAQAGCDIYIKTIAIVIADAGATLNKFGNITALTNGVEFFGKLRQTVRQCYILD